MNNQLELIKNQIEGLKKQDPVIVGKAESIAKDLYGNKSLKDISQFVLGFGLGMACKGISKDPINERLALLVWSFLTLREGELKQAKKDIIDKLGI